MSNPVILDEEFYERASAAIRFVEGLTRSESDIPTMVNFGHKPCWVRVTGDRDPTTGFYPGVSVYPKLPWDQVGFYPQFSSGTTPPPPPPPGSPVWEDIDSCWVSPLNSGETLTKGKKYSGIIAGNYTDGKALIRAGLGGGVSDTGGGGGSCSWLLDVPEDRIFKLTVIKASGRCACVDRTQGLAAGDVFYLVQNPEPGGGYPDDWWVGTRTFHTCCGCGRFLFKPVGDGTAEAKIVINRACDAADPATNPEPYEYDLKQQNCEAGTEEAGPSVTFGGAGVKLCDSDPGCNCDNSVEVRIECLGCCKDVLTLVPLTACRFDRAARSYFHDTTAIFSGDYLAYNGQWTLAYDEDASDDETGIWVVTCGETEVTITLTIESVEVDADGYGIQVTLLYEGAVGGPLTYTFGPVGRPTGTSTETFREYDCQELTFMLSNLVYDGTPPTGAPATAEHLTALVCERFVCCTGPGPDIGVGEGHSISCLDITVDNAHVVIPGDTVDCNMDITAEMESTGREFEWTSGNPFISDTETGGSCIGAGPGGADVGVSYTLACTSDGWRLFIVVAGSSIGTDFNTHQTISTEGICPDPFTLTFPPFSVTDGTTGDSYSHDGVTISLCPPPMMAARLPGGGGRQPPPQTILRPPPAARTPLTLQPCRFEGPVLKRCGSCRGNEWKAESRHVRKCSLPDNPTGKCSRVYTGPEEQLWACDDCEYNTNRPDPKPSKGGQV